MLGGDSCLKLEPALPNLTGQYEQNNMITGFKAGTGVYTDITKGGNGNLQTGGSGVHFVYKFNASKSNSIYQDDCTTVQPPAIALIPQIRY